MVYIEEILPNDFSFLFQLTTFSKRGQHWYFGKKSGINFSSGSPVVLTDSQLCTDEGVTSICNSSGELLFYTDGVVVYGGLRVVMPNGSCLNGNASIRQSAVIVPNPSDPLSYYIFTTDA